jgi:DeoR family transcriptional regulator of aga operon/DeoR family fructose operon transcriptional repressor
MLHQRRNEIITKIRKQRTITVADLMAEYKVSIETIRRDLEYLEKQGHLRRVYGGAVLHGLYGEEPEYKQREIINYAQKQAIGKKTAEFINDGDTLFFDVGTTIMEVAKYLRNKKNLTVITNATLVAHEFIRHEGCRVILLGGELRRGELSSSGFISDQNIGNFFANKTILGIGGITVETGVTDYYLQETSTRRLMVDRSDEVIAVADYSKFGVIAMNYVCPVEKIKILVTDWTTPAKAIAEYRSRGIMVYSAPPISEKIPGKK